MALWTVETDGQGYWSRSKKPVFILDHYIDYVSSDEMFGNLNVVFDTSTWNVEEDGLIYTDPLFLSGIRKYFDSVRIRGRIEYSEQGMQGTDYVSFDVYRDFLQCYRNKHPELYYRSRHQLT